MSNKNKATVSPKFENLVKGVFLILFSVVIALNTDYISRTLAFPFIYLFGAAYYFILAFFIFLGVYRIFKKEKFKFKSFLNGLGMLFIFLAIVLIVGAVLLNNVGINFNDNFGGLSNNYHSLLSTYYQQKYINVFSGNWGTGIIGLLLGALLRNHIACIASGIIIFLIGLALLTYQWIYRLFKKKQLSKKKEKKIEEEKKVMEEAKAEAPQILPEPEEKKMQIGFEVEEESFAKEGTDFSQLDVSIDDTYRGHHIDLNQYSDFSPLAFHTEEDKKPAFDQNIENKVAPSYQEIQNEEIDDIPHFEDSYLDENLVKNDKPQINEELLAIKPEFVEPVSINKNIPTPAPQVMEKPKKKERVVWVAPSSELLEVYETSEEEALNKALADERVKAIDEIFNSFGVGAHCEGYTIGSSVTRFNVVCDANVSVSRVEKMVGDIAVRLNGANVRFSRIVEGQSYSGLEIPNAKITTVGFKEIFESLPDVKKHPLAVGFGKNISGDVISADFDEFPHLLVAGTTGSGKSIYIHSIISTLIMRVSPDDLKIVLVDPKKVEMTKYRDMPHLLCPIITEADKAKVMLSKLAAEMNNRYDRFSTEGDSCSNIKQFNEIAKAKGLEPMPYIIIILDEYADLIDTCKEISQPVVSIAQKARAAGIHMLISTQRPSTNVITGVIKGNLPTHVALTTASYIDSMTVLGEGGAEKLLGKGDMLVQSPLVSRVGLTRLQGCYIQNKEINRIVGYLKEHYPTNYDENYLDLVDHSKDAGMQAVASGEVMKEADAAEEEKYQSIKEWVMSQQFVSISKIQRECQVGFNRAGRFFIRMQKEGVVSTDVDGSTKGCKVLMHDDYSDSDVVTSEELIG